MGRGGAGAGLLPSRLEGTPATCRPRPEQPLPAERQRKTALRATSEQSQQDVTKAGCRGCDRFLQATLRMGYLVLRWGCVRERRVLHLTRAGWPQDAQQALESEKAGGRQELLTWRRCD